jgi:hypothetical protein
MQGEQDHPQTQCKLPEFVTTRIKPPEKNVVASAAAVVMVILAVEVTVKCLKQPDCHMGKEESA